MSLTEIQLRDLALTNLMLKRLRTLFDVHCEVYVKWPYGGAFNGAAYACNGANADVSFYSVGRKPANVDAVAKVYSFSRGTAHISWPSQEPDDVTAILALAEDSFPSLLSSTTDLLHKIARVQFWLIFNSTVDCAQADLQSVADRITSLVGGSCVVAEPYEFPPGTGTWNGDIEIELANVVPEVEVHNNLTAFFARLEGSLFGVGADCPNHTGLGCSVSAVQYCHVTGRHF